MKIEGVPEGYELVRIGKLDSLSETEQFMNYEGEVLKSHGQMRSLSYPIVRKIEPSYAERQAAWVKENGLKVGDKVKVLRAVPGFTDGWDNCWSQTMNECVGGTLEVKSTDVDCGIQCQVSSTAVGYQHFPYFVLKKLATRPMTRNEFLAAWKERGWCPLVDEQGYTQSVECVDPTDEGLAVTLGLDGGVSMKELSTYRFASDDSPLTVTE